MKWEDHLKVWVLGEVVILIASWALMGVMEGMRRAREPMQVAEVTLPNMLEQGRTRPEQARPRVPSVAELEARAREERERKEAEELAREEAGMVSLAQRLVDGRHLKIKGHLHVASPSEEEIAGIFTVNLRLEVEVTDSAGRLKRGFQVAARGGGVTKELARQQADERLRETLAAKLQEDQ